MSFHHKGETLCPLYIRFVRFSFLFLIRTLKSQENRCFGLVVLQKVEEWGGRLRNMDDDEKFRLKTLFQIFSIQREHTCLNAGMEIDLTIFQIFIYRLKSIEHKPNKISQTRFSPNKFSTSKLNHRKFCGY